MRKRAISVNSIEKRACEHQKPCPGRLSEPPGTSPAPPARAPKTSLQGSKKQPFGRPWASLGRSSHVSRGLCPTCAVMRPILAALTIQIARSRAISAGLGPHKRLFDPLYYSMITSTGQQINAYMYIYIYIYIYMCVYVFSRTKRHRGRTAESA